MLCYLWCITYVGLVNSNGYSIKNSVENFVDSKYVGDIDRRSLTSYVLTLLRYVISWKEIPQSNITLFKIEGKYMILKEVVKEDLWLGG
jgi:hypothetical protein